MLNITQVSNIMKNLSQWFNQQWYQSESKPLILCSLAKLYHMGQRLDKAWKLGKRPSRPPLPVIVIGNISVGGTGKTPLVMALYDYLSELGIRVGIVTRGYRGQCTTFPYLVKEGDSVTWIGDEAAMLWKKTKAPIVLARKRNQGLELLSQHDLCDVILSDDGLQHYAMPRSLEIVVIDGERGFGNQQLLPLGPLREPISRLQSIDCIVINGTPSEKLTQQLKNIDKPLFQMQLQPGAIYPLHHDTTPLTKPIAAFAGIGHPKRFFQTLTQQGHEFTAYQFDDHHHYQLKDFEIRETCIIMTEKDAIKCHQIKSKPIFVLPVKAILEEKFWQQLLNAVSKSK